MSQFEQDRSGAANDNAGEKRPVPDTMVRLHPLVALLAKRAAVKIISAANDNAAPVTAPLPSDSQPG